MAESRVGGRARRLGPALETRRWLYTGWLGVGSGGNGPEASAGEQSWRPGPWSIGAQCIAHQVHLWSVSQTSGWREAETAAARGESACVAAGGGGEAVQGSSVLDRVVNGPTQALTDSD